MSEKISFIPLLAFLLIGLLLTGCSNSPQAAQKTIDKLARDMQAELPKLLDRDTKLVKVYSRKLELVSEYELLNYEPTEAQNNQNKMKIELYLKQQACPAIKEELLNRGLSSRYIYKDSNGRIIGDWLLSPGDC